MNRLTREAGRIFCLYLLNYTVTDKHVHWLTCARTNTHSQRDVMLHYTTFQWQKETGKCNWKPCCQHWYFIVVCMSVCVCDITHLRIYKNVFKMINMRCLRSLCGWIQWTWLQPCCTHIHRQHQKYWSINISRLMHIYETISYWEPCACLVSESKLYLSFLIYFSNYC